MKFTRGVAILMLAFLALSGIAGSIPMIVHPTGNLQYAPPELLRHSPFRSYLIPGILLLTANGLLSLWVLWLTVRKSPRYAWWVGAQGCVLAGWLIIEMILLRMVHWLHGMYGAVALILIGAGLALLHEADTERRT